MSIQHSASNQDEEANELNRRYWDERAQPHASATEYGVDALVGDRTALSDVIRYDLPRLGDIAGLRTAHLQCHIGTDTISLARLGARVTGLDFSGESIEVARNISSRAAVAVDYVRSDVKDAIEVLPTGVFDLVYTGIGALCWLANIDQWARTVDALLAPGGRLFVREAHPMLWALDDTRSDGLLAVEHPYFETSSAAEWDEPGTYVTSPHAFTHTRSRTWNHGLGEIVTAVLNTGLEMTMLEEHDSVPWNALPGLMTVTSEGEYRLTDQPERLPHTYTLQARKRTLQ